MTAKKLMKMSLSGGTVNSKKVEILMKNLVRLKPQGTISILKIYKRLVSRAIAQETLIVESSTPSVIRPVEKRLLAKTGAKKVTYKTNPDIVFGARLVHGDWIFDSTLDAKLNQVASINN